MNTGKMNLLEEMGRIDSEKMNKNRRAEKDRVISELNKGYKNGGKLEAVEKLKKVRVELTERTHNEKKFKKSTYW